MSCGLINRPSRRASVNRIESAERHADRVVDLLEAVDVDHHHGRPDRAFGLGEAEHRFQPVEEQFAVGQAGEVVVHGIVQQPLLGGLEFGDVGQRADEADHLAVGADHRPRAQREPQIVAVGGAHAEVLRNPPAALFDDAVERGAEPVAIERVQNFEPGRGCAIERSALESEHRLGFGAGKDAVGGDVPVPDHVAGSGQCQRAALDVGHDTLRHAAGEGVLHHRKADQHHDQDQAAKQSRADNVVGDEAGDGQAAPIPRPRAGTRWDQHHRAVETVGGKIDDQREAEHRDEEQRHAGDAGGDRRRKQRHRHERAEERQPADGDVCIAHMPAVEVQIREQKYQQGRGQDRFARRAPDAFGARRHVEHLAPESEIDADVDRAPPSRARRRPGNMTLPLTTNRMVRNSASNPAMPMTMPW